MHPLNHSKNFGPSGIEVEFYNGSSVVPGYILKQLTPNKFDVTDDGVTSYRTLLSPTLTIANNLNINPDYCRITVEPPNTGASGATLAAHYKVSTALVVSSSGTAWTVGQTLSLPSGAGRLTVATLDSGHIATVTVGTAGNYTSLFSSPTTGTRVGSGATIAVHYAVDSATIVGGGGGSTAGYAPADVLTLVSGGGAQVTVDTVDGGGGILTYDVSAAGNLTSLLTNPVSTTTVGGGSGATFTLDYKVLSVASSGGSNYGVGDTLTFVGMTATSMPTAHISTSTSRAATAVTVDTPGSGITVAASSVTTSSTTATFTVKYQLLSVSSSGGSGYAVNDELNFVGMTATKLPTAHISTATSGAATAVTVDSAGTDITVAATSITVGGIFEYVARIWENRLFTVEGHTYYWTLNTQVQDSAIVRSFNA